MIGYHENKNPVKHGGGFLLALYIDLIGTLMCINALYDGGIVALLLSPTTYLYVAIPLIIYFYRKHSNKSSEFFFQRKPYLGKIIAFNDIIDFISYFQVKSSLEKEIIKKISSKNYKK